MDEAKFDKAFAAFSAILKGLAPVLWSLYSEELSTEEEFLKKMEDALSDMESDVRYALED